MILFVISFFLLVNLFMSVSISAMGVFPKEGLIIDYNKPVYGFRIHFGFVHNGEFFFESRSLSCRSKSKFFYFFDRDYRNRFDEIEMEIKSKQDIERWIKKYMAEHERQIAEMYEIHKGQIAEIYELEAEFPGRKHLTDPSTVVGYTYAYQITDNLELMNEVFKAPLKNKFSVDQTWFLNIGELKLAMPKPNELLAGKLIYFPTIDQLIKLRKQISQALFDYEFFATHLTATQQQMLVDVVHWK